MLRILDLSRKQEKEFNNNFHEKIQKFVEYVNVQLDVEAIADKAFKKFVIDIGHITVIALIHRCDVDLVRQGEKLGIINNEKLQLMVEVEYGDGTYGRDEKDFYELTDAHKWLCSIKVTEVIKGIIRSTLNADQSGVIIGYIENIYI